MTKPPISWRTAKKQLYKCRLVGNTCSAKDPSLTCSLQSEHCQTSLTCLHHRHALPHHQLLRHAPRLLPWHWREQEASSWILELQCQDIQRRLQQGVTILRNCNPSCDGQCCVGLCSMYRVDQKKVCSQKTKIGHRGVFLKKKPWPIK